MIYVVKCPRNVLVSNILQNVFDNKNKQSKLARFPLRRKLQLFYTCGTVSHVVNFNFLSPEVTDLQLCRTGSQIIFW